MAGSPAAADVMVTAAELKEVEELEAELAALPTGATGPRGESARGAVGGDYGARVMYLELVRTRKLRRSELVARVGLELLNSGASRARLGNEGE